MTTNHISAETAKDQGLPGWDVYRASHLRYHDPLNRDAGVVHLNIEAYKAFSDTVLLNRLHAMQAENHATQKWFDGGDFLSGKPMPRNDVTLLYMDWINYEYLKIAAGFELHLKARLLERDFVVHELDRSDPVYMTIATKQKTHPISKSEIFAIQPYHFDGKQNYLPGLKETSLKFSTIIDKMEYRTALELPDDHLNIVQDYRTLRNQIHLSSDIVEAPNIRAYPGSIVEFLTGFINSEIVAHTNALIAQYQLNRRPLEPFL